MWDNTKSFTELPVFLCFLSTHLWPFQPNPIRLGLHRHFWVFVKKKKTKLLGSWYRVTLTWGIKSPNWMITCCLVATSLHCKGPCGSTFSWIWRDSSKHSFAHFLASSWCWSCDHPSTCLIHCYWCTLTTYKTPFKYLNYIQKTALCDHFCMNSFYQLFTNVLTAHKGLGRSLGHFTQDVHGCIQTWLDTAGVALGKISSAVQNSHLESNTELWRFKSTVSFQVSPWTPATPSPHRCRAWPGGAWTTQGTNHLMRWVCIPAQPWHPMWWSCLSYNLSPITLVTLVRNGSMEGLRGFSPPLMLLTKAATYERAR